jgi:hypothetical protein
LGHGFEVPETHHWIWIFLTSRRKDRTKGDQVSSVCIGSYSLIEVVSRAADLHVSYHSPRLSYGEVVLAEMQAVCVYEARDVSAIIDHEGNCSVSARGSHALRNRQEGGVVRVLGPKLHEGAARVQCPESELERMIRGVEVDDCVE